MCHLRATFYAAKDFIGVGESAVWIWFRLLLLAIIAIAAIREKITHFNVPAPRADQESFIITGLMAIDL